ncbi:hypothetical protein ATI53_10136 [Salipiger aestuarii]|uniref:Uncharacterized protein n=2 Tax=Salipiger aestuarii TaxID=568098 RepID=A0A327YCV0_9RHOB|nr:hypothetical protein ATI53_10136 [Salipiger aestuarii]
MQTPPDEGRHGHGHGPDGRRRGAALSAQPAEADLTRRIYLVPYTAVRLTIGFDFPSGYPSGFAQALTGRDDPFAMWAWRAGRFDDAPKRNSRFDLAGQINRGVAGAGPLRFNGLQRKIDVPSRRKPLCAPAFP